jgi:branched-chain amino acid aminotransferase
MLNTAGNVACATAGNLFCRIKGQWFTPTLTDGILCGLARKRLILRLTAVEASLSAAQILASEAVFVSNSLGFAQINSIDGHQLPGKFDEAAISSIYQD